MFWKKKKRKKSSEPKPKVLTQPQKVEKEIPKTDESKKKEETPKQKKPAGKKSEKVSESQKAFLDTFKKLTNRHRAWDVWRVFAF